MNKIDELCSVVPKDPDYGINWDMIESSFMQPYIDDMKKTEQNPKYHAEGNVWNHTIMVCESLAADPDFRACDERQQQELFLSALFHDIGKIKTTKKENGEWISPRHALVGAQEVRELLWREYGICGTAQLQNFRETICLLIRYHMTAPYVLEEEDPFRRLIKIASNGESAADFSLRLLFILSRADSKGRIADDKSKCEDDVLLAVQAAEEAGCYTTPVRFSSAFTEYAYLSGRNVTPDTELYNDSVCTVIMMCGLPGTGKDTFIKKNYSDLPMTSLDYIREEYGLSPIGNQNEVARIAKSHARQLLQQKRSFVWNATSVTSDIRLQMVSLFNSYHAYVKIIFLETDFETNRHRNMEREKSVPQHVIDNMLSKLVLPERFEAHEVEWKCV